MQPLQHPTTVAGSASNGQIERWVILTLKPPTITFANKKNPLIPPQEPVCTLFPHQRRLLTYVAAARDLEDLEDVVAMDRHPEFESAVVLDRDAAASAGMGTSVLCLIRNVVHVYTLNPMYGFIRTGAGMDSVVGASI